MITQGMLKAKYTYDQRGVFRNKKTGRPVLGTKNPDGYIRHSMRINGRFFTYRYHRLIYLFHFGHLPSELDHVNGIRCDNRIENLQPSNRVHNNAKKIAYGKNGLPKGVYQKRGSKTFFSLITIGGKAYYLGTFDSAEEAEIAFKQKHAAIYGNLS